MELLPDAQQHVVAASLNDCPVKWVVVFGILAHVFALDGFRNGIGVRFQLLGIILKSGCRQLPCQSFQQRSYNVGLLQFHIAYNANPSAFVRDGFDDVGRHQPTERFTDWCLANVELSRQQQLF